HVERAIRPALARGEWVLCDRYVDSTTAYQGGGLGLPAEEIALANRLATAGLMPQLTLVFLIDPARGLARKGRGGDRIEARDLSFHERVATAYRALCEREPHRCVPIAVDRLSVAAVHERVRAALREHLGDAGGQV
ncbi:MAG TPA: dTMP kinase, partial [Limnochordia bacterium]|nr:dTMP kinase [Limnochordia bacterium]